MKGIAKTLNRLSTGYFIETVTLERFLILTRQAYNQAAIGWAFLYLLLLERPPFHYPWDSWRSVIVTCQATFRAEPSIADRYCHRVLGQVEPPDPELCADDRCVWFYPRLLQATSLQLRGCQRLQRASKR